MNQRTLVMLHSVAIFSTLKSEIFVCSSALRLGLRRMPPSKKDGRIDQWMCVNVGMCSPTQPPVKIKIGPTQGPVAISIGSSNGEFTAGSTVKDLEWPEIFVVDERYAGVEWEAHFHRSKEPFITMFVLKLPVTPASDACLTAHSTSGTRAGFWCHCSSQLSVQ